MKLLGQPKLVPKRTKAERQAQRAHIKLVDASISSQTRSRYLAGLYLLFPVLDLVKRVEDLDFLLSDWLQEMWSHGEPLYKVSDALCALHFYEPWSRKRIPNVWRLFAVWRKLEVANRAPPLTAVLVEGLASYALAHDDLSMATLLLVGFYGLLRTGELLSLQASDILVANNMAVISLRDTKSGKRKGATEVIHISNFFTVECLQCLQLLRQQQNVPGGFLWTLSQAVFRHRFNEYCKKFDLEKFSFRPYSLRRGGATHLFQMSKSMETTLVAGRWSSQKTARIYIADGLSFLPSMVPSNKTIQMLKLFPPP